MPHLLKTQLTYTEFDKLILKCIQKFKGPRIVKTTWKIKDNIVELTFNDFKSYKLLQSYSNQDHMILA